MDLLKFPGIQTEQGCGRNLSRWQALVTRERHAQHQSKIMAQKGGVNWWFSSSRFIFLKHFFKNVSIRNQVNEIENLIQLGTSRSLTILFWSCLGVDCSFRALMFHEHPVKMQRARTTHGNLDTWHIFSWILSLKDGADAVGRFDSFPGFWDWDLPYLLSLLW